MRDNGRAGLKPSVSLVGRNLDRQILRSFVADAAAHGRALLLSGEPGVGKSALLDAAEELAAVADIRVLRAAGALPESDVSYSTLHQVLFPLSEDLTKLSAAHRNALVVALGLDAGPPADRLVVSNAALALLRRSARARPLLVIVDNLQWADRASTMVLVFIARRLTDSRVGFLAALRSDVENLLDWHDLPQRDIQPLSSEAAQALVSQQFPALASQVRQRLLDESQGNPQALLELAVSLSDAQQVALEALPTVLPLNRRMRAQFTSQIRPLRAPVRHLLLVAALDGTGDLGILQAAAEPGSTMGDLAPAERARLVHIDPDNGRLTFRHPLIRSAVVAESISSERRRVHQMLAELRADQPERRAWHLAEAAIGPDDEVAQLLEQAARRRLEHGDANGAVVALLRAAEMTQHAPDRSRRMAEAAYLGADLAGDLSKVPQRLADARKADPHLSGSLHAAVAAAYLSLNRDGDVDTAHSLLARAIATHTTPPNADDSILIEALHTMLLVCLFGGRAELWSTFHAAVTRLMPDAPPTLRLQASTCADPARTAVAVLDELDAAINTLPRQTSPAQIVRISLAASYVDRLADCREPILRVASQGRQGGAITSAIDALLLLCFDKFMSGYWDEAEQLADESLRLCEAYGYQLLTWPARYAKGMIAAARGDYDTAFAIADEMHRWAAARRTRAIEQFSHNIRTLAALGRADYEEAYVHATAISPAGEVASYVPLAMWTGIDITEAAVRTGRPAQACAHVTAMRQTDISAISPRIALLSDGAAAIVADDPVSAALFDQALARPNADAWPFDYARVQLAHGERLRRARLTTLARTHLSAALSAFERLGARPWAARASDELQAAGSPVGRAERRAAEGRGTAALTPREREIARLAAAGLTNKQIAERLFVTHRTVASHLYQVYPKLGIRSRAALHAALTDAPSSPPSDDQIDSENRQADSD